jgi:Flp pilus assembly protein TadG
MRTHHPRSDASCGRHVKSRGQALAEFAIIMPLFALILFSLLDFGRVIYAQNTVSEAAREAGRVGAVSAAATPAKYDAIRAAAVSKAVGLGLTTANISGQSCSSCFYPDGAIAGGRVVVTITKSVPLLTPIISQIVGGSFTVSSTSRTFIQ